jgi:hypothetical protein
MSSGLRALAIHLTKVSLGKALVMDVSFLQVILEPFYLEIHMFGS